VLDANVAAMAAFARDHGLVLRPHAKTHKSPDVARLQLDAGAVGLTVATVSEAEVFAAAGCTDLFVAYPLWVDAAKGARLRALADSVAVTVGVDSVEGARALAAQLPGAAVLVEVDAGLDVRGVFTFPGHSYSPGVAADVAAEESAALRTAVASMGQHGVETLVASGGSTPSARAADDGVLTELRPGVYVFGDAQQWELGTIEPTAVALTCVATVASHAGGHLVLDSGSKALGADRAGWATGYGRLLDHPDAPSITPWSPGRTSRCCRGAAGFASCPTTSATRSTSPTSSW
jgi:D-serine deaminase-like pyridoxal phosphate-dependent protein